MLPEFLRHVLVLWVLAWSAECRFFNMTKGGLRLQRMPAQFIYVMSYITSEDESELSPDCVGAYIGGFNPARDQLLALTSPYCSVIPFAEVRTATQDILVGHGVYYDGKPEEGFYEAFEIQIIQLNLYLGDLPPSDLALMVLDKNQFQKLMEQGDKDNATIGFALAVNTNPAMAFTVTWKKKNCANFFDKLRKDKWPNELPEGAFCVFRGNEAAHAVYVYEFDFAWEINPSTPCDDAVGSPVLLLDFITVLGVIIYTFCGEVEVAFAISPAFLPEIHPPTSGTTTMPPTVTPSTTPEPTPPPPRTPRTSRPCSSIQNSAHLKLWSIFAPMYSSLLTGVWS